MSGSGQLPSYPLAGARLPLLLMSCLLASPPLAGASLPLVELAGTNLEGTSLAGKSLPLVELAAASLLHCLHTTAVA